MERIIRTADTIAFLVGGKWERPLPATQKIGVRRARP